jgi:hypothetical protein
VKHGTEPLVAASSEREGMIRIGVTTRARLVRHALEPGLVDGRTCTPFNHGR